MKKLMCAVAAVAAGVAFAENLVQSAEVVGYNNTDQGNFTFSVSTFKSLTATEANMKIGEISTNSEGDENGHWKNGWNPDVDKLSFFSTAGKQGNYFEFVPKYRVERDPEWEGWAAGWYDPDNDPEYLNPITDTYSVPFGAGYFVKASSAQLGNNPKLAFAGQVKTDIAEVPCYNFTIAGFCRPSAGTINDIESNSQGDVNGHWVTGWNPDTDKISFFSATGKQGNYLELVPKYRVEKDPEWEGWAAGWYDPDNDPEYLNPLKTPLNPGDGFFVKASSVELGNNPSLWINPAITQDAE